VPPLSVTVEGFQSIERLVTINIEGLTVITGPSNIGKSALIRAFNFALENKPGSWFITDSRDAAQISIVSGENSVTWHKSRKTSYYRINGREYKKSGRGIPDGVDALGFYIVSAQGSKYRPQIHRQLDRPFIIGENSPITAAELLAATREAMILARALKIAKTTSTEENAEVTLREKTLNGLKKSHQKAAPCKVKLEVSREKAERLNTAVEVLQERSQQLKVLQKEYRETVSRRDAAALRPIDPIDPVPDFKDAPILQSLRLRYKENEYKRQLTERVSQLRGFEMGSYQKWETLHSLKKKATHHHTRAQLCHLPTLRTAPPHYLVNNVAKLKHWRDERRKGFRTKDETAAAKVRAQENLQAVEKDRDKILKLLGVCPLCGKSSV